MARVFRWRNGLPQITSSQPSLAVLDPASVYTSSALAEPFIAASPAVSAIPITAHTPAAADANRFLILVLSGKSVQAFQMLRMLSANAQSIEAIFRSAIGALSAVHRTRFGEGSADPALFQILAAWPSGALEEMMALLTAAVDGSYQSPGLAAKIALVNIIELREELIRRGTITPHQLPATPLQQYFPPFEHSGVGNSDWLKDPVEASQLRHAML